jgi:sugar phosphate permease
LSQYLPGAIPWGALTIFIFPFSYKFRNSEHSLVATYMVFLSIGMLIGSLIAGFIADKLNQIKKIFMLVCIIVFLLLSSIYFYYFVSYYTDFSENLLFILFLIMGSILSIPGTYIKGLLFMNASEEEVQKLFAIENFLESLGKGFGPLIVGILIFITSDLFFSFQLIGFFWVLCLIPILIIFFDEYKNEKRPQ